MKRGQLIGLTGYATAGKDVAADALAENEQYRKFGFADALYKLALWLDPVLDAYTDQGFLWRLVHIAMPWLFHKSLSEIVNDIGWTEAKRIPAVREFLQEFGMAVRREVGEDAWVNATMRKVDSALTKGKNCVITNVRFKNEAEAVRSRDGLIVRVDRPGTGPVNGHVSDQGEAFGYADTSVKNNGTKKHLAQQILGVHQSIAPQAGSPIDADAAVAHFENQLDRCCTEAFRSIVSMASPGTLDVDDYIESNQASLYALLDDDSEHYQVNVGGSVVGSIRLEDGVITTQYRVAK